MEVNILSLKDYIRIALILIALPIWLPITVFIMIIYFIMIKPLEGLYLKMRVRSEWYPRNKYILFVYSDSPNWKEYIETNMLAKILEPAIIMNWSERSKWAWNSKLLEVKVFKYWANVSLFINKGEKQLQGNEFNPIAIVFAPGCKVKVFRFWKAFKDYKHGKTLLLKKVESELYEVVESIKR